MSGGPERNREDESVWVECSGDLEDTGAECLGDLKTLDRRCEEPWKTPGQNVWAT